MIIRNPNYHFGRILVRKSFEKCAQPLDSTTPKVNKRTKFDEISRKDVRSFSCVFKSPFCNIQDAIVHFIYIFVVFLPSKMMAKHNLI